MYFSRNTQWLLGRLQTDKCVPGWGKPWPLSPVSLMSLLLGLYFFTTSYHQACFILYRTYRSSLIRTCFMLWTSSCLPCLRLRLLHFFMGGDDLWWEPICTFVRNTLCESAMRRTVCTPGPSEGDNHGDLAVLAEPTSVGSVSQNLLRGTLILLVERRNKPPRKEQNKTKSRKK